MNATWTFVTIIASVVGATATVMGIYFSHRHSFENRIKDLESRVENHDKFVKILEKRALSALEEEFSNPQKTKAKQGT